MATTLVLDQVDGRWESVTAKPRDVPERRLD